jgi:hypothetical protein
MVPNSEFGNIESIQIFIDQKSSCAAYNKLDEKSKSWHSEYKVEKKLYSFKLFYAVHKNWNEAILYMDSAQRVEYSSVWCICGHKELSDMWTSNNKKLDNFIKKSQMQTNSAMMPMWNGFHLTILCLIGSLYGSSMTCLLMHV